MLGGSSLTFHSTSKKRKHNATSTVHNSRSELTSILNATTDTPPKEKKPLTQKQVDAKAAREAARKTLWDGEEGSLEGVKLIFLGSKSSPNGTPP
jgi:hypothetical protein